MTQFVWFGFDVTREKVVEPWTEVPPVHLIPTHGFSSLIQWQNLTQQLFLIKTLDSFQTFTIPSKLINILNVPYIFPILYFSLSQKLHTTFILSLFYTFNLFSIKKTKQFEIDSQVKKKHPAYQYQVKEVNSAYYFQQFIISVSLIDWLVGLDSGIKLACFFWKL